MFEAKENINKNTLVLGGTGKTGSRIVKRLNNLSWPVRIGSRSANPKFDWEDRATWEPALYMINSVYISFYPDLAIPGAVETIHSFVKTAIHSGVQRLVLLSGRGESEAQKCEQIVMNSGVDWTVLRSSWFNQIFSESYLLEPVLAGYVALPAGNVGEPFTDADDIADAAVKTLTKEGPNNQLYELTGPRLLTFNEALEEISKVTGKPINYEQVSLNDYEKMLKEYNVPPDFINLITYLFKEVLDGRNESVTDGVQQALGRKAADFSDYVQKTVKTGVWNNGTEN